MIGLWLQMDITVYHLLNPRLRSILVQAIKIRTTSEVDPILRAILKNWCSPANTLIMIWRYFKQLKSTPNYLKLVLFLRNWAFHPAGTALSSNETLTQEKVSHFQSISRALKKLTYEEYLDRRQSLSALVDVSIFFLYKRVLKRNFSSPLGPFRRPFVAKMDRFFASSLCWQPFFDRLFFFNPLIPWWGRFIFVPSIQLRKEKACILPECLDSVHP